jgi:hypothetical protein
LAKSKPIKRPYATHYFTNPDDKLAAYVTHGACSSEKGAIRATVVRIFMGEHAKAVVIDRELDIAIYTIKLTSVGLQVSYGRDQSDRTQLRRVK